MDENSVKEGSTLLKLYRRILGPLVALVSRKLVQPVLKINDSPHALSLGLSMGLFVALTPTVGIQMPIVFLLGTVLRANRVVALAMTWVTNPVTTLPFYYLYYQLGRVVLGRESISYERLGRLVSFQGERSAWDSVVHLFNVLGWPLWLGSLIIAVVLAPSSYPIARRYFERREVRRATRKREDVVQPSRREDGE